MRLIDADNMTSFPYNLDYCDTADLDQWIAQQATVDAELVRHGRWYKPTGMMPPEHAGRHRCTECNCLAYYERPGREGLSNYCPNCGAKMDLK